MLKNRFQRVDHVAGEYYSLVLENKNLNHVKHYWYSSLRLFRIYAALEGVVLLFYNQIPRSASAISHNFDTTLLQGARTLLLHHISTFALPLKLL